MALQFVPGNSGAGKSFQLYQKILQEAGTHPERKYLVIVPEQFTMQTQKELVALSPRHGIMNVDILSFDRLAHRVFAEVGGDQTPVLEDVGKILVLERVVQEQKKKLGVLGSSLEKLGTVSEMKSLLSELMQYDIHPEELDEIGNLAKEKPLLYHKLKDVQTIYQGFSEFLRKRYITAEEVLDLLCEKIGSSRLVRDSWIALDGFTGFTPVQNRLIGELLKVCDKIMLTVEIDRREDPFVYKHPYQLFALSKQMVTSLTEVAQEVKVEIDEPVWLCKNPPYTVQRESGDGVLEEELIPLFQKKIQWGKDAVNLSSRSSHTTGRGTVCGRGNPASGERRRIQISGNRSDCF